MFATPAQSWSVFHHELLVRIVPRWNFFAPNPGIHDYHLLIRDRSIDGEVGPWISITEFDSSRPWYACVWNPEKRRKKALFDTTCILVQKAQLASEEEMPKLQLSIPYLLIASLVDTRHRSPLSVARQFCLVQRSAQAPIPLVVFTSAFHSLVESEG
jgi:hypothetical protein